MALQMANTEREIVSLYRLFDHEVLPIRIRCIES